MEALQLITAAKGDGHALHACATRSSDAVDVGLGLLGYIVVDHSGQLHDVDTARRDIGGDKYVDLPCLEAAECCLTGILTLVSVNGQCLDIIFVQQSRHLVGTVLGASEHQRACHSIAVQ